MRRRLKGASKLLAGQTVVTEHDYRVVLERCTAEDLIYMDPPYQGVVASRDSRYAPRIDREEFIACLETLNERGCRYLVSYDGRTGEKRFGEPLPASLRLAHVELAAGRSSQATLLGRVQLTFESLYVSPTLARKSHSHRLVG
jgi:DNA adenine methylase